jgi:hypothetical protein
MHRLCARGIVLMAVGLGACFAEDSAQGADSIADGGFESPAVPDAGFVAFAGGEALSSWSVVGTGRVAVVKGDFVRAGTQFVAAAGKQWLDLAGVARDPAGGVQQIVKTTPGRSYRLRFKVGNVVNPAAGFGRSSTVLVRVNGAPVLSATHGGGNAAALSWKPFKLTIVPTTTHTTIAFFNGDPAGDNSNGLDAVSLTAVMPDDED